MYCLTTHEIQQVAGAGAGPERVMVTVNDCLKISEWRQLHSEAQREGIMLGAIGAMVTGVALYSAAGLFAASTTTALGVGAVPAIFVFMYGYSHGYDNYELWPWN